MRNRLRAASALEVSEVCLGAMTWGEQNTEAEAHVQIFSNRRPDHIT